MRRLLFLSILLVFTLFPSGIATVSYGAGPEPTSTPFVEETPEPATQDGLPKDTNLSLTASVRAGGSYRVGSWLPVAITVQNDGPDMVGEVRLSSTRGSAQFGTTIDLPRNSRKSVTVYAHVSRFTRRLTARLFRDNKEMAQQQIVLDPHPVLERLVAVTSSSSVPFRLPPTLTDGNRLVTVALPVADFPHQFAGFSSFDALVLDDAPLNELQPAQMAALREWIAAGGQLIISGGEGATRTLSGLPEELRPVTIVGTKATTVSELLPLAPDTSVSLDIAEATPLPGTASVSNIALATGTSEQLLFDRLLGKGSITFSALRLNEPTFSVWEGATAFWSDLLNDRPVIPPGFGPTDASIEQMVEGNIASSLTRLPALELPSLTLMGILLLAYVILAGPVTYLVLRRLDRQALGWVVVPVLTVVFAGIAYGVGYARRGGDVVINEVAVIEPLGEGHARVRSFVGLFSPSRSSYTVEMPGQQLLRPVSLGGPWDTSDQPGVFGPDRATELDVPQWSMRAVMSDNLEPYDGLRATITLEGETLQGEVINGTGQILRDVTLVQDVNVGKIGDLQPGERKTVTFGGNPAELANRRAKFSSTPLSYMVYNDLIEQQGQRGGQPLPPIIQLRQGLLDAIYAVGPVQRNATPLLIAWGDEPTVTANVPAQKVARQRIALITLEPTLVLAQPTISLDQGWFQRGIETSDPTQSQAVCMGTKGLGINPFGPNVVQTLTLPKTLRGLEAQALQLIPTADAGLPQEMQLELYNWQDQTWVPYALNGQNRLTVEEPIRFLSIHTGQIRARLTAQSNPQGGCMYLDAMVTGQAGT